MACESTSDDRKIIGFMGLLFKKYSDPLTFLDLSVELIGIKNTVKKVYEDEEEQKQWEMYLSVKPKSSFKEWKNQHFSSSVTYANRKVIGTKNKAETDKIIEESRKILKDFKLVKGGKYIDK